MKIIDNFSANDIAFMEYLSALPQGKKIPDYWKYTYGVDTNNIPNIFLSKGYMTLSRDYQLALKRLNVPELKEMLQEFDLKVTGNKPDLIERILQNISEEYLEKHLKEKDFYILTEKGKQFLEQYDICVVNKKNHFDFSNTEINEALKLPSTYSTNDRIWSILNTRLGNFRMHKKWSSYRMTIYYMGNLLYSEDKFEDALKCFIAVFMIDLSALQENNFLYDLSTVFVAPGIINKIENSINLLGLNEENLRDMIETDIYCNALSFQWFSKDTLYTILCDTLNGKEFDYKKYPYNKPSTHSTAYKYFGDTFEKNETVNETVVDNNIPKKKKGFWGQLLDLIK